MTFTYTRTWWWGGGWTMALSVVLLGVAGCASIAKGSRQKIEITSTPSAATVIVDSARMGSTPVTIELKRGTEYTLRLELQGYRPYEMKLTRSLNGWVFGNVLFGGPLGVIIDASTGAMYKINPNQVNATLASESEVSTLATGTGFYVGVVMRADPAWEYIGRLEPAL